MSGPSEMISASALEEMLVQARANGSLETMIAGLMSDPTDSEFELLSEGGTMRDASKRRLTSPPPKLEPEKVMSDCDAGKQHVGTSPHSYGLKLPTGISSVDQWGCTMLELGKCGKEGFAYEELASSTKAPPCCILQLAPHSEVSCGSDRPHQGPDSFLGRPPGHEASHGRVL